VSTRTAQAGTFSRPMLIVASLAALALSLLWVMSPVLAEHGTAGPAVAPSEVDFPGGEPSCPTGEGVRFQNAELADDVTKGHVTLLNVDVDAGTFDFEADAGFLVSYVFAKGSTPQNVYNYSGFPGGGVAHDDGLVTPINDASGKPAGISHIDFCVVTAEEESEAESEEASGEQSVEAGTGTPEESTPDGSLFGNGSSPLPTIAFSLILLASLGGLAYANVKSARNLG